MAKIIELREQQRRKSRHPEGSLAIKAELCSDVHLRNLIDNWIVPKMIDDWMNRSEPDAKPTETKDNGEHQ
jgi:hypothetical protein